MASGCTGGGDPRGPRSRLIAVTHQVRAVTPSERRARAFIMHLNAAWAALRCRGSETTASRCSGLGRRRRGGFLPSVSVCREAAEEVEQLEKV